MPTLNAKQLKACLALVSKAVATKSTLPILGNVKIAAQSAGVSLAATNLELTIETTIPYGSFSSKATPGRPPFRRRPSRNWSRPAPPKNPRRSDT